MAGIRNNNFGPQIQLSPNQQDLLLAALVSNNPDRKPNPLNPNASGGNQSTQGRDASNSFDNYDSNMNGNQNYFSSPQMDDFNSFNVDESPFGDFLDDDQNLSFDTTDGDQLIGGLPGEFGSTEVDGDLHDKRKSPEDENNEVEISNKKKEGGEDKTAKKPGRKPLTSEPTTKRKAQNRAAQRAFRERKEKHLKDLETKVEELEKKSESTNHENGLLRAQVTRLQTELREYRKRLSLGGMNRSPPVSSMTYPGAGNNSNNFQFDFPRFGTLPGNQVFGPGSLSKSGTTSSPTNHPTSSTVASAISPQGRPTGDTASPTQIGASPSGSGSLQGADNSFDLTGLSSSGIDQGLSAASSGARGSVDSTTSPGRVFRFNSSSATGSPSASSVSQYGQNSSCDTSPEPSHGSPSNGNKPGADSIGTLDPISEDKVSQNQSEGELTFCDKLNMACGNPRNPIPRAISQSVHKSNSLSSPLPATNSLLNNSSNTNALTTATDINGLDWLASQNGGQFDPLLFGDYRESQAAIVGTGEDFSNGFFNDAFLGDFSSPFNLGFGDIPTGLTPAAINKSNPLEQAEKMQAGIDEEEVVPGEDRSQMMSCHKIWDKLQERSDFKDGNFDIDGLCSELRSKARCSESGVVVDQKDVDAALKRLPVPQQQ